MSRLLTTIPQLRDYLAMNGISWQTSGLSYLEEMTLTMPLRLSTYYADLIDWHNPIDPLRLIAIPQPNEALILSNELLDPIGDAAKEVVPGLIHRYPDRCLLLLTTQCRIHCRFCFRRDVIGKDRPVDVDSIRRYLHQHEEVQEVIFSGGDPFTLQLSQLSTVLNALSEIKNIERIRFHTRIPAIDPEAISQGLLTLLQSISRQVVVVLHVDHATEVTALFKTVVKKLYEAHCMVVSQSVLLRGVNDSGAELKKLFSALTNAGVKPYYLHHLDQAQGTSHFRCSIEEGMALYTSVANKVSPLCLPQYVLDLPGGYGKVPVNQLKRLNQTQYQATTFEGKQVVYTDPAA